MVIFLADFALIIAIHQIEMISFIKLRRVAGLADLHGVNPLIFICVF